MCGHLISAGEYVRQHRGFGRTDTVKCKVAPANRVAETDRERVQGEERAAAAGGASAM